ncbi:hypothetical protein [Alkalilacustris brevis]|uniref:hypothetical protein n=1 Tax=Alkalilacustris brevis TaxID=2026338 RepID=UPI000E0D18B8|nr:hypothetical protein [Alkalilacustris brevis]
MRRFFHPAILSLGLVGALWVTPQPVWAQSDDDAQAAQRFYAAGQAAMDEGDRLRAVAAWRLTVRHDPTHLQGWIALGDALLDTDPAFAATAYRRALSILTEAAPAVAQAAPTPRPLTEGAETEGVLAAVAGHLQHELGRPVHLSPLVARRYGAHAFLIATVRRPDGRPLDWENTPYADMWAADMMSDTSMTLLEEAGGSWHVREHETGPTDVAWFGWMQIHDLPQALFMEDE